MFSYENLKRNIWGTRNCILPYPWRPFTHSKEENEIHSYALDFDNLCLFRLAPWIKYYKLQLRIH